MRYNGLRPRAARDDLRIRERTPSPRRNSYVRGPSAVSVCVCGGGCFVDEPGRGSVRLLPTRQRCDFSV